MLHLVGFACVLALVVMSSVGGSDSEGSGGSGGTGGLAGTGGTGGSAGAGGDGTFQAAMAFAAGTRPFSVFVADLNADTVPDLVTANVSSNDVSVLLGQAP